MVKKAGWEGELFIGPAGTQAPTRVTRRRDLNYEALVEYADTTDAGSNTTIPVADARPVKVSPKVTFNMVLDTSDTALLTLISAATNTTPTPLAIYAKSYSAGKGFDGDCYISMKKGMPYQGETTYDFECTPTTDGGRAPVLNAS